MCTVFFGMDASVTKRICGLAPNGEAIEAWTLYGAGGLIVEVITYGATVTRILAPDRHGGSADVVLGFHDAVTYTRAPAYFGATVGRVAGRITGGKFNLSGRTYKLIVNDPPNHLHGGLNGFDKQMWKADLRKGIDGEPSLWLSYRSAHLEEGYPGIVDVTVKYSVTPDNVFRAETYAVSDRPTPFSTTFHHYFNLAGESSGTTVGHKLQIHADHFIPTDEHMTLLGKTKSVAGSSCDFRRARSLDEAIPRLFQNHGDLYVLGGKNDRRPITADIPAARLVDPESGRTLEIYTTASHLQLYTGAKLNGSLIGKSGTAYGPYAGLCLECEGYPDGANAPELGDIVLRPDRHRREVTTYAFGVER